MKNLIFMIPFIFILGFSCTGQENPNTIEIVLTKVFSNPIMQDYLHSDLLNRKKLYIIKNDLISNDLSFNVNDLQILSKERKQIKNPNYIELKKLDINDVAAEITFYYKIENIEVNVLLKKKKDNWNVDNIKTIEL